MKKKTIVWITVPLFLLGFVLVNWSYISQSVEWKLNWGFEAPRTTKIETVFDTRNGFPAEGETFWILKYRTIENKLTEKDGLKPINQESFDTVSNLLENFQKNTADINHDTQNYKRLFQEYPVSFTIHDRYFYKLDVDNSYILAISNTKEHRLYVMEWIQ